MTDPPVLGTSAVPITDAPARAIVLKRFLQTTAFVGAYLIFGILGLVVSVVCLLCPPFFKGTRARCFGQKLIHGLFAFFVGYLRYTGLLKLDTDELSSLRDRRGLILAANHPCLLDAVFVISQLPQVVCLMKGSLVRNLVLCGTASLAGYVNSGTGLGLVRQCTERLEEGASLLIFPEGTRSVNGQLQAFKMGFALIAMKTHLSIQTIIIDADSNYLGKGWPFFRAPTFPLRYSLRLGRRFDPPADMDAKDFGNLVEEYYRGLMAQPHGSDGSGPP